jgi:hypothetical protein
MGIFYSADEPAWVRFLGLTQLPSSSLLGYPFLQNI